MKKLKDLMNRQFATVRPDAEVREVARLMKKQNVGFIPVCDEQRIHGIITDRDIVMRVLGEKMDVSTVKARDIMSKDVFWCFDDDSFETAAKLMQQHRVRRLLVLDLARRRSRFLRVPLTYCWSGLRRLFFGHLAQSFVGSPHA